MTDSVRQRIEALSAQVEGLEAAAAGLEADPEVGISVRRIARSLEIAANASNLGEVAAGAAAIQKAADAHLSRSVANFLARLEELRDEGEPEHVTILIVEDDRVVSTATEAYLRGPAREIIVAPTAEAADSVLSERDVHLVLLDLLLPDRDGRDLLMSMREHAATSMIPVIVVSSLSGVAEAECLAVGADEFLSKPVTPKALRAAAARQLRSGKIRLDAIRDGLTGLPNRAGISAEFQRQQDQAASEGTPLSVAVVELDALADITSTMGQDAADQFVLETTAALHGAIGPVGRLGRWEPAELVAVLPATTAAAAKQIIEAAIRTVIEGEALAEYRDEEIDVTLTGGVALIDPAQDLHEAISAAERSVYDARRSKDEVVGSNQDEVTADQVRVLVVEDDQVTATLIHHRLSKDGHEVVEFSDGAEAFAWAEANDFGAAVLDVKVPGMDGFELLSSLRAIPRYAEIPIIMLTAMGSESAVVRGLDLGADDYVLKPFSPIELLARVRRLLNARPSGPSTSSATESA